MDVYTGVLSPKNLPVLLDLGVDRRDLRLTPYPAGMEPFGSN